MRSTPTSASPTDLEVLAPSWDEDGPPPVAAGGRVHRGWRYVWFDVVLTVLLVVTAALSVAAAREQRAKAAVIEREHCERLVWDFRPDGIFPQDQAEIAGAACD